MPVASFKDLCLDAADPAVLAAFWARVLDREASERDGGGQRLTGATPAHTVWIDRVPEPRTVKSRVHLDIYARRIADLEALGSHVLTQGPGGRWTVLADPEGGEFCAFLRDELPAERLHGLVVDSTHPQAIGTWWHEVLGGSLDLHGGEEWATVENIPGFPIDTFDFVPVPEPKTVKNRVHWDVTAHTHDLVARGAQLLRTRDDEIGWDVLADPEGNEFCVFAPT